MASRAAERRSHELCWQRIRMGMLGAVQAAAAGVSAILFQACECIRRRVTRLMRVSWGDRFINRC